MDPGSMGTVGRPTEDPAWVFSGAEVTAEQQCPPASTHSRTVRWAFTRRGLGVTWQVGEEGDEKEEAASSSGK